MNERREVHRVTSEHGRAHMRRVNAAGWHADLVAFIVAAGALGVSTLVLKEWAKRHGRSMVRCTHAADKAVERGELRKDRIEVAGPGGGMRWAVTYRRKA